MVRLRLNGQFERTMPAAMVDVPLDRKPHKLD